ncbi:origin recognition complex, subunit 2 [Neohortaea acidophila]|uniref:Origin recognition complex subunit 2 n=1 Tax=Neohortaea acidophila TaxID=245834 RepID=A0A6A6PYH1_9PEZI|nr:origin recognition complex, subunit 2 [Neohortaea acidophila]KAF2484789.1 origin recognition complex, subunit 2 [Neohortaea acidophila]
MAKRRRSLHDDGGEQAPPTKSNLAPNKSATRRRSAPPSQQLGGDDASDDGRRHRTPSPPPDLPPHELFFAQNRAAKTSANTLSSAEDLLDHDDYFTHISACHDSHENDLQRLKQYHRRAFDQWGFELKQGFNLCLYGYGSKRKLAMEFAEHLHAEKQGKIVVVNGYAAGLTIRHILTTLASSVLSKNAKLPAQPASLADLLLNTLLEKPSLPHTTLFIHSFDHPHLRKPATQLLLARLAAHPSISIVATCDTLNFPLSWDTALLRQFRWLYHDATTFHPFTVEVDVVESVNALLGRSGRRLGGRDGVGYVLKSLPENARNLFRILVAEQLALTDAEPEGNGPDDDDFEATLGAEDEEEAAAQQDTPSKRGRGRKPRKAAVPVKPATTTGEGVEYRTLYHKAVEEFVCSSELSFRTLLKEFIDHSYLELRKDIMGTERLVVPFRREELETILEELV